MNVVKNSIMQSTAHEMVNTLYWYGENLNYSYKAMQQMYGASVAPPVESDSMTQFAASNVQFWVKCITLL